MVPIMMANEMLLLLIYCAVVMSWPVAPPTLSETLIDLKKTRGPLDNLQAASNNGGVLWALPGQGGGILQVLPVPVLSHDFLTPHHSAFIPIHAPANVPPFSTSPPAVAAFIPVPMHSSGATFINFNPQDKSVTPLIHHPNLQHSGFAGINFFAPIAATAQFPHTREQSPNLERVQVPPDIIVQGIPVAVAMPVTHSKETDKSIISLKTEIPNNDVHKTKNNDTRHKMDIKGRVNLPQEESIDTMQIFEDILTTPLPLAEQTTDTFISNDMSHLTDSVSNESQYNNDLAVLKMKDNTIQNINPHNDKNASFFTEALSKPELHFPETIPLNVSPSGPGEPFLPSFIPRMFGSIKKVDNDVKLTPSPQRIFWDNTQSRSRQLHQSTMNMQFQEDLKQNIQNTLKTDQSIGKEFGTVIKPTENSVTEQTIITITNHHDITKLLTNEEAITDSGLVDFNNIDNIDDNKKALFDTNTSDTNSIIKDNMEQDKFDTERREIINFQTAITRSEKEHDSSPSNTIEVHVQPSNTSVEDKISKSDNMISQIHPRIKHKKRRNKRRRVYVAIRRYTEGIRTPNDDVLLFDITDIHSPESHSKTGKSLSSTNEGRQVQNIADTMIVTNSDTKIKSNSKATANFIQQDEFITDSTTDNPLLSSTDTNENKHINIEISSPAFSDMVDYVTEQDYYVDTDPSVLMTEIAKETTVDTNNFNIYEDYDSADLINALTTETYLKDIKEKNAMKLQTTTGSFENWQTTESTNDYMDPEIKETAADNPIYYYDDFTDRHTETVDNNAKFQELIGTTEVASMQPLDSVDIGEQTQDPPLPNTEVKEESLDEVSTTENIIVQQKETELDSSINNNTRLSEKVPLLTSTVVETAVSISMS